MTRRKLFAITAGVLLLFAAIDFWQRIFVPRHQQVRAASSFVPAAVPAPASSAQIRKDLSAWLPKLAPIAEGAGPAAADAQWELQLLAVFDDQSGRFAVVRATPAAGGAVKILRVVEGGDLYGYKVARIEPQRVKLEGEQGTQELRMFRPKDAPIIGAGSQASVVPSQPAARAPVAQPGSAAAGPAGTAPPPAARPAQQAASGTPARPAAGKGPKTVETQELKPGQAFELPESMRGLKVLDAPVPPPPPKNP
jgi:hypothetical protein